MTAGVSDAEMDSYYNECSLPWLGYWARQGVPKFTIAALTEENVTSPHFSSITSFRGPLSLNVTQIIIIKKVENQ